MPDIVFGGVFGAFLVEQVVHAVFNLAAIVALFDNVILMKHVAEKMPVIKLHGNLPVHIGGQLFDPVGRIAFQRDVERDNIFHLFRV